MTAVAVVAVGCTGTDKGRQTTVAGQLPKDTVYTKKAAMSIYGYQPLRALQIVDSAVIVGNLGEVQADQCRARIYGMSLMTDQLDSLLGGPADVRLDTARAIGERLLRHDSIKGNLLRHRDVLEILTYVDRKRNDMQGWIERSREMVDVCRKIGPEAETDALRMEAEIGAAYHETGRHKEGNPSDLSAMTDEQLYQYIDNIVIRELLFLDPNFENLLSDMIRIADVSSNVGESVVIRVRPELADKEHHYFRDLRHEDPNYNRAYLKARDEYFEQLSAVTSVEKENAAPAQPGQVISAAVRDFDDA